MTETKESKASVSAQRTLSEFQRHNFSQQRIHIDNKLKLRSLYKGIQNGSVKAIDPFDFKQEFKSLAQSKLNQSTDKISINKTEILDTVKNQMNHMNQTHQKGLRTCAFTDNHEFQKSPQRQQHQMQTFDGKFMQSSPQSTFHNNRRSQSMFQTEKIGEADVQKRNKNNSSMLQAQSTSYTQFNKERDSFMPLRESTMLRDATRVMHVMSGTLAHNCHPNYILPRNDRHFSKRVYTEQDSHTGQSLPYMRSSIDLSFDGGNYLSLKKDIEAKDLKSILASTENKGKFTAPLDKNKIQNKARDSVDLKSAFYNQNMAKTGVRRFTEPSEGDSIFNLSRDMSKKNKLRDSLGQPHRVTFENCNQSQQELQARKSQDGMQKQMARYVTNPEDVIQDIKRTNLKRMLKQSEYVKSQGYSCAAIQSQMRNTSRRKAILDKRHDQLKQKIVNGQVNFADVPPMQNARSSLSSLKNLVGLHKPVVITKQDGIPSQTTVDLSAYQRIPQRKIEENRRKNNYDSAANKAALAEIKRNYQSMQALTASGEHDVNFASPTK